MLLYSVQFTERDKRKERNKNSTGSGKTNNVSVIKVIGRTACCIRCYISIIQLLLHEQPELNLLNLVKLKKNKAA